jgi:hypothetical protein
MFNFQADIEEFFSKGGGKGGITFSIIKISNIFQVVILLVSTENPFVKKLLLIRRSKGEQDEQLRALEACANRNHHQGEAQ